MRGAPVDDGVNLVVHGIIPADAGSTSLPDAWENAPWDHPRGCGEHVASQSAQAFSRGSSPRMRGALGNFNGVFVCPRIIPADAGSTLRHSHP